MKRRFCLFSILPLLLTGCSNHDDVKTFISNARQHESFFNDSYFLKDNKTFHQEIALISYANALATIEKDDDYPTHGDNLYSLVKSEGFQNIYLSETFKIKPTLDSVAYSFSYKQIEDFTLVNITVRSGSYGAEWASNITIGEEGNAKGFQDSSDILFADLGNYLNTNNISGHTKFWLSGYSRGGSIANLTAGNMLNKIQDGDFFSTLLTTKDDIYAYCFEPPLCVDSSLYDSKNELYQGIHNIINFNDFVAKFYPSKLGFVRFGRDYYYPDRLTDIYFNSSERRKMISTYHFAPNGHRFGTYTVDEWKFYDCGLEDAKEQNLPRESVYPSMGRFVTQFINIVATSQFFNRQMYYQMYQPALRDLINAVFGFNPKVSGIDLSGSILVDILFTYSFAQTIFAELQAKDYSSFASDLEFMFYMLFNANEENIDEVKALYDGIYYLLLLNLASLDRTDLLLQLLSRDNLLQINYPHSTELNYYFLKSCDERLYGKDACKLNDGTYQTLHIKTPAKISIFENNLKKQIFNYENGKMITDTLSAEKLADGSIDIYLPKNGDYNYEIDSSKIVLVDVDQNGNETIKKENLEKTGHF